MTAKGVIVDEDRNNLEASHVIYTKFIKAYKSYFFMSCGHIHLF